jgi:hypothetical protein
MEFGSRGRDRMRMHLQSRTSSKWMVLVRRPHSAKMRDTRIRQVSQGMTIPKHAALHQQEMQLRRCRGSRLREVGSQLRLLWK